jgi:hypothetical protein
VAFFTEESPNFKHARFALPSWSRVVVGWGFIQGMASELGHDVCERAPFWEA